VDGLIELEREVLEGFGQPNSIVEIQRLE